MDYPAAHSMDSCWFATDQDGHVAYFETGEGGCMPSEGFPVGGEAASQSSQPLELLDVVIEAMKMRAAEDAELAALVGTTEGVEERLRHASGVSPETLGAVANGLGIFVYECRDDLATPYVRNRPVASPLALARLPRAATTFGPPRGSRFDSRTRCSSSPASTWTS
jgi:hypothetical protein